MKMRFVRKDYRGAIATHIRIDSGPGYIPDRDTQMLCASGGAGLKVVGSPTGPICRTCLATFNRWFDRIYAAEARARR